MERATARSALLIKREIFQSAQSRVRRTPRARSGWVKYVVAGNPDGATASIYPRGGYAILGEKGSYKKPGGYRIPREGRRRRGRGWKGPFKHPAIKAQPYWQSGVDRAWPSVQRAYYDAVTQELKKHFP